MLSGKVWGDTRLLLNNPHVEFHHIHIEPHKRCSLHLHRYRANAFFVFKGTLIIEVHKAAYDLVDRTVLGPGDFMVVPPNEKHRFLTGEDPCEVVEFYFPWTSENDIVRDDVGGAA